jgi:DNA primase
LSFVEAVRDLAQGVGMAVPEEDVSPDERKARDTLRQRRLSISEILRRAADFYRAQLKATSRAVDYCKQRGLSGQVAARYGMGFAPPGWRTLAGVFPSYDDPLLEEAGLVRQREAGDGGDGSEDPGKDERGRYDWFRDRVMFPIRSVDGKVIGFGGRVLDDSKPKYINSPETPVFSKGRELYGLFEARQALRDKGYALVVEGYMDVVALAQNGFGNAVATLGTACTAEHVQKLFRFTDSVVFSFDGDAAGRRAAARALEAALPHAGDLRSVRFLFLPPEHDPDSYVRELGTAAFEALVAKAVPLSRQLIELAAEGADLTTAEGRSRMLAQAKPLWQALPDGALKRQLLPELARQAQLEMADLSSLWGTAPASATRRDNNSFRAPPPVPLRRAGRQPPAASADLALRMLLRHSDWWEKLAADDQELLHGLGGHHGAVVTWLEGQWVEHGPQTWSALEAAMAGQPWQSEARAWVNAAAPEEEQCFDDLHRVLQRLLIDQLNSQAQVLAETAADDRGDLEKLRAVHEQIARIKAALTVSPH